MQELYEKGADGTFEAAPAAAVMEAGAELAQAELDRRGPEGMTPDMLKPIVKAFLADKNHELQCAFYLDVRTRLIEAKVVAEGTQIEAPVNIREICKTALANAAYAVVLVHNHPGGTASPSPQDRKMTKFCSVALAIFEVKLLDTWVVAGDKIYMSSQDLTDATQLPDELKGLALLFGLALKRAAKEGDDDDDDK